MDLYSNQHHYAMSLHFSNKLDGDMRDLKTVHKWLASKQIDPIYFVNAKQIHGTSIGLVSAYTNGSFQDTDGLVSSARLTAHKPIVIGVTTADCMPILCFDSEACVVGAVHAGWRGTNQNIIANCIMNMIHQGARIDRIHVVIGPHIRQCCYEVSSDMAKNFREISKRSVQKRNNTFYLDLSTVIIDQLITIGMKPTHISCETRCTSCYHELFFSYRKHYPHAFGEQLSIISLKPYEQASN